jgi:hypothetical protein
MSVPLPHLLSAMEVATWLVMPTRTIEKLARDRQLPAIELPDGSYMFEAEALTAWMHGRRTQVEVADA